MRARGPPPPPPEQRGRVYLWITIQCSCLLERSSQGPRSPPLCFAPTRYGRLAVPNGTIARPFSASTYEFCVFERSCGARKLRGPGAGAAPDSRRMSGFGSVRIPSALARRRVAVARPPSLLFSLFYSFSFSSMVLCAEHERASIHS